MSATPAPPAAPHSPLPPAAHIAWSLVLLLGALTSFAPMSIDMYLPSLPAISRDFAAPASDAQLTVSAFLAGLALGQLFYGPASDRWGRRPPLLFGIGLYVVGAGACALAPSIDWLVAARFIQAIGGCAGAVVARAAVRDRFDARDSARVLSLLMLVMGLAPIIAPFFGALVLTGAGWRMIFWILCGFGLLMGLVTYFGLGETRSAETAARARSEHPIQGYWALLCQPRLVGFMASGAFNSGALFAYVAAAPGLIIGHFGVPTSQFVWVFGANAGSMIAMSQVNAHLLRRHSPERILQLFRPLSLVAGLAMVLGAVTGFGGIYGVLIPLFFVFASFGFIAPNTMAAGLSLDPLRVGSTSALMGGIQFGVGALASAAITLTHDTGPVPLSLVIFGCMLVSTVALFTVAMPKAKASA